ncbi:uncharacterized protein LOC110842742 isoform X1 [Folsomia candida]|uniref:uncharacterized protein LOC110842742 isoform X1 n=1 Tax=Folsomia candida TaxID=158441 RepID=UPI000B8F696A|nr:uncharacterized protein LOC110842742 isoform X1 [Folsomia candida]
MDRLHNDLNRLDLDHSDGDEWTTVESPSHRRRLSNAEAPPEPILVSSNCPFNIYQMPKLLTDELVVSLVNNVVDTGPETKRLLLEVTHHVYVKNVVILRGVPGCGKSTVAKALLATTRKGTICSADDFFTDAKGKYVFNPQRLSEAHETCQKKCKKLMEKGISPVIIDNTNTRRFELEVYVKMAIENNYYITIFEPETEWRNNARILVQKTVHQVPRNKIEQMVDRFEQIIPFTVVEDVRKKMGPVGQRYCPEKAVLKDFTIPPKPAPTTLLPLFGPLSPLKLHPLMPLRLGDSDGLSASSSSPVGVPRTPLLSEFVMDSLATPSASTINRGTYGVGGEDSVEHKQSAKMAAIFPTSGYINTEEGKPYCAGKMRRRSKPDNPKAAGPSSSTKSAAPLQLEPIQTIYSESVLKAAQLMQEMFPTFSIQELAHWIEIYGPDGAINEILDSNCRSPSPPISANTLKETKSVLNIPDPPSAIHNPKNCVPTPQPVMSGSSSSNSIPPMRRVSIDKSLSVSPVDGARGLSPSGTNGPESFKMKVPNEFIKKLASMYGSPNDPVIQAMLGKKDGVDTPVPSEIGFEIYQKLIKNAEAKACKEAEEAAKD